MKGMCLSSSGRITKNGSVGSTNPKTLIECWEITSIAFASLSRSTYSQMIER
jgi:hypothetical protein